ncbi:MAG: SDR family NAD(P)-dependent oxidoreductase [Bacteroidales bacterium]|nr:SDR family NAD(P)-dependent oxidoreductase [Bacteroidales bacterium]
MESKVIVLTGASSGIGFQTARLLAGQGHKVYGAARRVEMMEPLVKEGVVPIKMDITDESSVESAVKTVLDAEGRIDVLINNAGFGFFGAIETVPIEEARRQLEVNVFGLARITPLVIPVMRQQKSGRIVNISSVAGRSVLLFGGWYHVSKYSVEAFSDALRMELKPFGIDVSMIEPGAIKTNWGIIAAEHLAETSTGTVYQQLGEKEANLMKQIYSGKMLSSPSVISKAISRAVNDRRPKARYVTGFGSHSILFFKGILPARWWDAMLRKGVGKLG